MLGSVVSGDPPPFRLPVLGNGPTLRQKGPVSGIQGPDFSFLLSCPSRLSSHSLRLLTASEHAPPAAGPLLISPSGNDLLTICTCRDPAGLQRGPRLKWATCGPVSPTFPEAPGPWGEHAVLLRPHHLSWAGGQQMLAE